MNELSSEERADLLRLAVKFAGESPNHFEVSDVVAVAQAFVAFVTNQTTH